ncbi:MULTISPECIES: PucR family transcriptional regulator [Rhodococcus]|uniref:PucR C-terminal helix-turn-helix domain-containing protein n=1 Tax=Rhodococcus jostii (strain RHA1) TaxID=101510 RepID=Q0S857_RHOJR|nr:MULTISPECIES: PucR family transcriptional regulator [Rhodococcus]ABG96279.1 conserved hypothetical protein [Rhodococcus jostii RHA1]
MAASPDPSVAAMGRVMLGHADELGAELADLIRVQVDFYGSSAVVAKDELRQSCAANIAFVFRQLSGDADPDIPAAAETGTARARAGVPLPAVMDAYRVGFRFMWEATIAEARRNGDLSIDSILDATSQILLAQDTFTQAMTTAYRKQLTIQILSHEEERSALVEALLFRRITDRHNLWEIADTLRLPTSGPYVVVAAEVPEIGRLGLPEIASKLDVRDIRSAWRLLPDLQVGIVYLRAPAVLGTVVEVLEGVASSRVGISPRFDNLAETGEGLRLARLAIAGEPSSKSLVALFDDSPLAFAAASAPDTMTRIRTSILGPLDELPDAERQILVTTFEAWLDTGGSANDTATAIFCHPNTVRHRLRRIEERTGRSLSRPRDVAELCLAFEIERRRPRASET